MQTIVDYPAFQIPRVQFAVRRFPKSGEKRTSISTIALHAKMNEPDFIKSCIETAYPRLTQSATCSAAAMDIGASPETIRRWLHGISRPGFVDFWPVIIRIINQRGPDTCAELLGMLDDL